MFSNWNTIKEYYQSDEEIIQNGSEIGKDIINVMNRVNEGFTRYSSTEISEDEFIHVLSSLEEDI